MIKFLLCALLLTSLDLQAKLVDKIAGVINDQLFTLSEVEQIKKTLKARQEISPLLYPKDLNENNEILNSLYHSFIIKDKLNTLGYVVTDDAVESRINETERRLNLNRSELLKFLKSKSISFEEYFEVIRQTMEYNILNSRVIAPLISISDQELKTYYLKHSPKNKALEFNYEVVDFFISENRVLKNDKSNLVGVLSEYQRTGTLPEAYKDFETLDLGLITDGDLPNEFSKVLKVTDEGHFSTPILKDKKLHVFYLKKKDLKESNDYLAKKELIYNELFTERAVEFTKKWFEREYTNYYIQSHL